MKQKKPPPGATLIARLKEQRLAREAELARRQQEASGGKGAPGPTQEAVVLEAAKPPIEPAAGKESEKSAAQKTTPKIAASADKAPARPASTEPVEATIVVESAEEIRQALVVASSKSRQDLLHREIDIDDLRPTSSDYFVLTDEIRLAGRFAAVGLIAQGLRLVRLKEAEIYKDHYQTFEDYCRKEHHMSATYAYRLIRMAEMAEQVARLGHSPVPAGSANMPDPFEVMISLGHRHLMALLPLEMQIAQELLINGIPVSGKEFDRVPLTKATERQIRDALKNLAPTSKSGLRLTDRRALVSEKQLIPALSKLVEMLEDWALWLDGDAPKELQAARMGRGPLLGRLAKRFRAASGKIADALEGTEVE